MGPRDRRGRQSEPSAAGNARVAASVTTTASTPPTTTTTTIFSPSLRHPTPDIHTLHGAYVRNVQKLERSAEELSAGGSDIGEEIRKMNELSRQSSMQSSCQGDVSAIRPSVMERMSRTTSAGGRVPSSRASGEAYRSPQMLFHSPTASTSARFASFGQPTGAGTLPTSRREFSFEDAEGLDQSRQPSESSFIRRYDEIASQIQESLQNIPPARPPSTDTFREAQTAFRDFDGVHYDPLTHEIIEFDDQGNEVRRTSARTVSNAGSVLHTPQARTLGQPVLHPGQDMVYYPAPVPRMLNLPKRLSQLPSAAVQSKRLTQTLRDCSDAGSIASGHTKGTTSSIANLPPQARAELFFNPQPVQHHVELKSGSAVATLDSILAASATAPVSAFTDLQLADEQGLRPSTAASRDGQTEDEQTTDELENGEADSARPSTLLAELQIRKAQHKSRARSAVTAFPNGMHSTLLELDAVQEITQRQRRGQKVELAWENPYQRNLQPGASAADENVPLGMLYPGKDGLPTRGTAARGGDRGRPSAMLDEESLSSRRTRLRAKEGREDSDDDENETLAQRSRRMKIRNATGVNQTAQDEAVSNEFAEEMLGQLGALDVNGQEDNGRTQATARPTASPASDAEETLGQRKARLQRERNRDHSGGSSNTAGASSTTAVHQSTPGTLLHANAAAETRQRAQIQATNLRASSQHLDRPLVDVPSSVPMPISNGLLANAQSTAPNGAFAGRMYNNGMGGIQFSDGSSGSVRPYFSSPTAKQYGVPIPPELHGNTNAMRMPVGLTTTMQNGGGDGGGKIPHAGHADHGADVPDAMYPAQALTTDDHDDASQVREQQQQQPTGAHRAAIDRWRLDVR